MTPKEKICIIGCGAYGSYLLKQLLQRYDDQVDITVVEVGGEGTQNSEEIGMATEADQSKVSRLGRYFGLGGTSARWGGQILFFDDRDVADGPDSGWQHVIELNKRHRQKVLKNLLGGKKMAIPHDRGIVKHGIWLGYFKRNLFKRLSKEERARVTWITNTRVTDLHVEEGKIRHLGLRKQNGETIQLEADTFYLTAGALESCRLLQLTSLPIAREKSDLGRNLGDHVSVELFRVFGHRPVLAGQDLTPTFIGSSLLTKRLVVTTANKRVNYAHIIVNKDVEGFSALKQAMFGKNQGKMNFGQMLQSIWFFCLFGVKLLFKREFHIHGQNWSLQFDIDQGNLTENTVTPADEADSFGEKGIVLNWRVSEEDRQTIADGKAQLKDMLDQAGYQYEELFNDIDSYDKVEDTFHPVGFIRMGNDAAAPVDFDFRVKGTTNLYHFSTALFKSAKSINPTGAGFCLVEEHLEQYFSDKQISKDQLSEQTVGN